MSPLVVTVFECVTCGQLYKGDKNYDAAKKCCVCKCGSPVRKAERGGWRSDKCERCSTREALRSAHHDVRRLTADLAHAKERVAQFREELSALNGKGKRGVK